MISHQKDVEYSFPSDIQDASIEDLKAELSLTDYRPVPVIHCNNAYGMTLTHKNGSKVTYSGDTRPSKELIEAGHSETIDLAFIFHLKICNTKAAIVELISNH